MNPFSSAGERLITDDAKACLLVKCPGKFDPPKEKWQQASRLEAKNTLTQDALMYYEQEVTHFKTGDPASFNTWGVSTDTGDTVTGAEGGTHYDWEMSMLNTIYTGQDKAKVLAKIIVQFQGETWYKWIADTSEAGGDGTETYDTKLTFLKYMLEVDGKEVPLELEGKISDESGTKWKTSWVTVEWAKNWVTLSDKKRSITIEPGAADPVLAAFIGVGILYMNPFLLKFAVQTAIQNS